MDWNNLGGPLRGGVGVLLQVMIGTKFEEEKKKHNDFTIYNH